MKHIRNLLAEERVPSDILSSIQQLDILGGLIGEFAYPNESTEDSAGNELAGEEREEVESRIVQVEFLPQRLFDAIRNEPKLMRGLEPRQFEEFTADLLSKLGFGGIQLTPRSGDGGRDIIATRVVNDIPVVMAFECKKYAESNKIGPNFLRALLGHDNPWLDQGLDGCVGNYVKFHFGRAIVHRSRSID